MSRLFKRKTQAPFEEGWLMTYADMITLLLGVFLIMLSISEPKKEKMEMIENKMKERFGIADFQGTKENKPFSNMIDRFKGLAEDSMVWQDVFVSEIDKGVAIEMRSTPFFSAGSAALNEEGKFVVAQIAGSMKDENIRNSVISVEGHTDDSPISNAQYPSNWELSSARAASVLRVLQSEGIDNKDVKTIGYADTIAKFPNKDEMGKPIPDNQSKNRRVVILIEKE